MCSDQILFSVTLNAQIVIGLPCGAQNHFIISEREFPVCARNKSFCLADKYGKIPQNFYNFG